MKNYTFTAILSTAALAGSQLIAGGNLAAATENVVTAPPAQYTDWTGPYAGAFAGAGSYAGTAHDKGGDALDTDGQMIRLDDFSGEAGIAIGYNFQRGNLVYGAEFDYAATKFSTAETYDDDYRQDAEISSLLTLRGRIGLAVDKTLIYGTAGFGRADIYGCASDDEDTCVSDDDEIVEFDGSVNGLVFGAGIEHLVTDNLSVRFEYLQFESEWTDDINYDSGNDDDIARFSADSKAIRIGVNYHF